MAGALGARVRFNARFDGGDVGAVGVRLLECGETAELVGMWVHPPARGKGAGDALVQTMLSWALEAGAANVHLWVTKENIPAERLYERNGFVSSGEVQLSDPVDPARSEIGMQCPLRPRLAGSIT